MHTVAMKNLHVPLPEPLHRELRAAAARERRPATDLARQAIDTWLAERRRKLVYEALRKYAQEMAGSSADLDPQLEAAGLANLLGNVGHGGKAT
ncbi:MAG: hypothetical protein ABSE73_07570 [Planctomycetota bacterium]